ncbi:MAG: Folate transporter 3 [Nitrospira sp.]|nr:MAG: Folate transporter 3 [Nitrospira sp.]
MMTAVSRWIDRNILELARDFQLSYLPPLMVYMAAGISGLTGIVGTFFVKDYLGLSASFLAALGFWAGIPWALKMPFGHLVDLLWRWKSFLVYFGAAVIAASLLIMVGLIGHREAMAAVMPAEVWYVLSALLAPIGYVIQDTVADAMTVEAVPRVDERGLPIEEAKLKLMHTTMQTLGRVAIISGGILVALINLYLFTGVEDLPKDKVAEIYQHVYLLALTIPAVSVLGVITASALRLRAKRRLLRQGMTSAQVAALLDRPEEPTQPNWWILGGSLLFVLFTLTVGMADFPFNEEIVFAGSMAIVSVLMVRLTRELAPDARHVLVGTALVVFVFRSVPGPGEGATWWMIDKLGFDQHFLSVLSLIGSALTLAGMFLFRRFMAERSIAYVVGFLTVAAFVLGLPIVSMYYGLHEWTAALTGGLVDARFIALVNTALESPLGQISMIPMLAWIANSAPANLKATYFAVMASFTNLALSLSQLGTKYLNEVFVVTREVRDPVTNAIQTPDDYSQLGILLIVQTVLGLALPFAAILFSRFSRFRSA